MTRVLQVLGRSAGGIARHVAGIVESLDGTDHLRIDVAGPPDLPLSMPKQVHDVLIPDGPRGHRRAVGEIRELCRTEPFDLVHAHGLRAGVDAARAVRRRRIPVLVTVHNLVRREIVGRRARIYRIAEDLAVRLSTHTFAVSEDIAAHLSRRIPSAAGKIEVLHLGAGPPPVVTTQRKEVRESLEIRPEEALIVTAARLAPQKSLDVMLHALALLSVPSTLAVLGVGPMEGELRALAARLDLDRRVRWLGFRDDIADHLAAADLFALSSIWEGVPLAAMEAIQLGTPIVATAVGGMPELVTDGRSGRLVEHGVPRSLADAMREVLTDDDLREAYVANARTDLERNFSTERMLDRLRRSYVGAARA